MQTMYAMADGQCEQIELPDPSASLFSGIQWGRFDEAFTPAYWKGQCWQADLLGHYRKLNLGRTLLEEVAACLLGGYGMPAEIGLAAYRRMVDRERLQKGVTAETIETDLSETLMVHGKSRRYRFPRQKARYLATCIARLADFAEPAGDLDLRNDLMKLPGIGPKTASWIVRNYRTSDEVAILDIHIIRAGVLIGFYDRSANPSGDYARLEDSFLRFARSISVGAGLLDGLMWHHMRVLAPMALTEVRLGSSPRMTSEVSDYRSPDRADRVLIAAE